MSRNRAAKARGRMISDTQVDDQSVEQDLTPAEASKDEESMEKAKVDPAARKARLDREVQAALDTVSALAARSKKKGKKHFPTTALQKRMQSGDI